MDEKGSAQKASSYSYSGRKSNHSSTAEDLVHNLDEVKNRVFRTFEETTPSKFRTFFKSSKYDKFLHALIFYFVSFFKLQNLQAKKDSLGDDQSIIGKHHREVPGSTLGRRALPLAALPPPPPPRNQLTVTAPAPASFVSSVSFVPVRFSFFFRRGASFERKTRVRKTSKTSSSSSAASTPKSSSHSLGR